MGQLTTLHALQLQFKLIPKMQRTITWVQIVYACHFTAQHTIKQIIAIAIKFYAILMQGH